MQTTRRFRTILAASVIAFGGVCIATAPASSHEDGPQERTMAKMPRAEGRVGNQELVITYQAPTPLTQPTLTAYLQRYTDGEPTGGATVELTVDFVPGELTEVAPGVYESHDWSLPAGRSDIDAAVTIGSNTMMATIPLNVTTAGDPSHLHTPLAVPVVTVPGYVFAAAAGGLYVVVSMLFLLRRRAKAKARTATRDPAEPIGIVVGRSHEGALVRT